MGERSVRLCCVLQLICPVIVLLLVRRVCREQQRGDAAADATTNQPNSVRKQRLVLATSSAEGGRSSSLLQAHTRWIMSLLVHSSSLSSSEITITTRADPELLARAVSRLADEAAAMMAAGSLANDAEGAGSCGASTLTAPSGRQP